MAFVKKPFGVLLLGGGGVSIAQVSGGFGTSLLPTNSIDSKSTLDQIKMKISDVADFLKIGNSSISQSDLVKEYVLTLSGAKDFARILVGSLIIDLVDHIPDGQASVIQKNIKKRIDDVRLNSVPGGEEKEKQEIYKLYGGEDKYKSYQALNSIRKIAIEELSSYLPIVLENATNDLKGTNDSDDLIKNALGLFYDKLLDDYIAFSKPIFVKRFFFEYKSESIENEVKNLFVSSNLPSDFEYPKKAGYLFPYLKSKNKWEDLKSKLSTISNETPSETNSDDLQDKKQVIPLTIVEESTQSSQFIISILKLQAQQAQQAQPKTIYENNPETIDEITRLSNDAVYFRDHKGVHVLVKDSSKDSEIKKHLISAAKSKSNQDYRFDLQGELRKWMEKHFERIFLDQWQGIKDKQHDLKQHIEKYKDVLEKLKPVLESVMLKDTLIKLRKNLIKDYAFLVEKFPPMYWSGKMQQHPLLKFAGKFAGKFAYTPNNNTKFKDRELVYADLENAFLNQTGKTTMRQEYQTNIADSWKNFSNQVSNLVSTNSNELSSTLEKDEDSKNNLYIFKSSKAEKYLLGVTNFFNNLWIHMIHDGSAENYLFQKQLLSYLNTNIFNKNPSGGTDDLKSIFDKFKLDSFKGANVISQISQDLFKTDGIIQDFSQVLFRRIVISKIKEALKSSIDPSIYAKELLHKLKDLKEINSLETIFKDLTTVYGDEGYDILSSFQKNLLSEIATIEFLSRDGFNNFRKLLKHKFAKGLSASFVFSMKYSPNGICSPDVNNLDDALKLDHSKVLTFNNEFLGHSKGQGSGISWKSENCLTREEFFDFAILKADGDFSNIDIKGAYKGLVFSDKYSDVLSSDIAGLINKLPIWGKLETIIQNIKEIKTEASFEAFIKQLKEFFPQVSWSFVEEKNWINPYADYRSNNFYTSSLTLDQRKKILANFVNQQTNTVEANSSLQHKYDKQNQWSASWPSSVISNSFLSSKLTRHNGYFTHNNSKLLVDTEGNKHLVYLIQMKYDDLKDSESWKKFLKEMSSDLITDELVKLSRDKSLQKQVIYHLLNEKENGMKKITIGDSRLRNKLGVSWMDIS